MYSSEYFEKLWFLYKLEGQSNNFSIESFCLQQGVSYQSFYKWFSSRKNLIVPVEIIGLPGGRSLEEVQKEESASCSVSICKSAIQTVSICLSNGAQVSKSNLSYPDLCRWVEKLEVLC